MNLYRHPAAVLVALAVVAPLRAGDTKDVGFQPMFNGKDLTGWVNVNCAPGTFFVKDGEIITTGKPTGFLRTERQYENFIAEFDWMHVPPKPGAVGNSGFFVWCDPIPAVGTGYTRGIEVQVLVNLTYKNKKAEIAATSQGDLFSIHGATCVPDRPHPDGWDRCLPSENHCKGEGEWNHYRVEANGGVIKLAVNGHFVSGLSKCKPRKGYLALESEGSECHFKNLKIKELSSTNPTKDEMADEAQGHKSLYTGLDLSGWKVDDKAKRHWQPRDWMLHYDGKGVDEGKLLRTEREFAEAEFIVDFRFPKKDENPASCLFTLREGKEGVQLSISTEGRSIMKIGQRESLFEFKDLKPAGQWNRMQAILDGPAVKVTVNGKAIVWRGLTGAPQKGALVLRPEGETEFANLFVREKKK
jgi:hypothetical protein